MSDLRFKRILNRNFRTKYNNYRFAVINNSNLLLNESLFEKQYSDNLRLRLTSSCITKLSKNLYVLELEEYDKEQILNVLNKYKNLSGIPVIVGRDDDKMVIVSIKNPSVQKVAGIRVASSRRRRGRLSTRSARSTRRVRRIRRS